MANKKATYQVETKIDTGKAAADAKRLAAIFRSELSKISVGTATKGSGGGNNSIVAAAKQAQAQQTADLKAQTAARIAVARAEAQERIQAARANVSQIAEAEKRTTAQFKAELAERTRAQRAAEKAAAGPRTSSSGSGGLINRLGGAALGLVSIQAARQAAQYAVAISQLRTEALRAGKAFEILSGGAKIAEDRITAVRTAAGGTVSTLDATRIATQAISLGLANTTEEFGRLTQAARVTSLISPVIHDVSTAISELGLAAANLSFRRLDQLGLSVTEVKAGMEALQAANAGMSDNEAFLKASVDALINKGGEILQTAEASASGLEQLQVSIANLKAELATGWAGAAVEGSFGWLADEINNVLVGFGSKDQIAQLQAIKDAQEEITTGFLGFSGNQEMAGRFGELGKVFEFINSEAQNNLPGIEAFREELSMITNQSVGAQFINDEDFNRLKQLRGLTQEMINMGVRVDTSAADAANAAKEAEEARLILISEAVETYKKADEAIGAYAKSLAEIPGITPQELTKRVEQKIAFVDAGEGLAKGAIGGADDLVKKLGLDQAKVIIEGQLAEITRAITEWEARGITGPELDLNIANLANQLSAQTDEIISEVDRLKEAANLDAAISQLNSSLQLISTPAFDGVEGIAALRDELISLSQEVGFAGGVTDEVAAKIAYLDAVIFAATDSASAYGQTQAALGVEFLNTNDYVGSLATEMAILDGSLQTGAISADYHRAALIQLVSAIYAAAQAAGAAAPQLASLLALKNALLASGPVNTVEGLRGAGAARSIQQREALKAGMARREQLRDQQEKAAKDAAKGFKSAASSAAKDFNAAAKSTKQAFENAAKTLESALRKVPGLFGKSEVTQEQLDLAAAGGSVNMADDYLRRLRDEVKNGKDWADVSIQGAKEALERIGIVAGSSQEEILAQFEEAWTNSSLFADKANLALINQDAVRQQLQIQDKIKQGQQNILDLFGATVDGVMAGVKAGDATSIGLVANELEGSDDKAIQEMAKGLRDKNQAMIDKVLALAVADPVEAGGGGGGGGGGALDIPETPIFDPAEFYDSAVAPFVDAGAQLSSPEFFAGFDAFGKKVNDWQASVGAAMPMSPGMFGPAALPPLAASGSMGAVAGPALTVDPTQVTGYMQALYTEFTQAANTGEAAKIGKGIAQVIGVAMSQADMALDTMNYVLAVGAEFEKGDTKALAKGAGKGLGGTIAGGLSAGDFAAPVKTYTDNLDLAFRSGAALEAVLKIGTGLQGTIAGGLTSNTTGGFDAVAQAYLTNASAAFGTIIPNFTAIGDIFAMFMKAGFNEHDISDMDDTYLNTVTTQFATLMPNMTAIGDTNAAWIGQGFTDHDFSGLADGMIADLKAAFGSDSTASAMYSMGGLLVPPLFRGFQAAVKGNAWFQTIVDEIAAQSLDVVASATVDAQSATVVTGAGVQR